MRQPALPFLCAALLLTEIVSADDRATLGEVKLSVTADQIQPAGWPIVVELTLTNAGEEPIRWWCGGPDVFPSAGHFVVQVRYVPNDDWRDVIATNGQYIEGSGNFRQLAPGESTVVPLAVPIENERFVFLRIRPREWHAASPAEAHAEVYRDRRYVEQRQARVIAAALQQNPPFWQHLAERYADSVVIDAMLKMATVDNAPIVAGAARVLACQRTLPESDGDTLAPLVARWLSRSPLPEWGGLREWVARAALKTQSESARQAALDLLEKSQDERVRSILIDELRLSPGDADWLRRARAAILAVQQQSPNDAELTRQTKRAVDGLDSRLAHPPP